MIRKKDLLKRIEVLEAKNEGNVFIMNDVAKRTLEVKKNIHELISFFEEYTNNIKITPSVPFQEDDKTFSFNIQYIWASEVVTIEMYSDEIKDVSEIKILTCTSDEAVLKIGSKKYYLAKAQEKLFPIPSFEDVEEKKETPKKSIENIDEVSDTSSEHKDRILWADNKQK